MKEAMIRLLYMAMVGVLLGCQSSSTSETFVLPDPNDTSPAEGAAFTASSMHFRKPMPDHSTWQPVDFYYKECSAAGEQVYYSKTSYVCNGP